ncbi:MAG TPA: ribonuclease E/G, partial [Methylibium sp.]
EVTTAPQNFADTVPVTGEGAETGERGRRRRRRGGRDRGERIEEAGAAEHGEDLAAGEAVSTAGAQPWWAAESEQAAATEAIQTGVEGGIEEEHPGAAEEGEREGSRRRRGRDRNRRERREGEVAEGTAALADAGSGEPLPVLAAVPAGHFLAEPAPAQQPPATALPPELPKAEPFVLPMADLAAVAEAAGLRWVNSDADKVQAAQEAIANTPRLAHVPREPRPVVAIDEGPLVLVETRKDLSQVKLPF